MFLLWGMEMNGPRGLFEDAVMTLPSSSMQGLVSQASPTLECTGVQQHTANDSISDLLLCSISVTPFWVEETQLFSENQVHFTLSLLYL